MVYFAVYFLGRVCPQEELPELIGSSARAPTTVAVSVVRLWLMPSMKFEPCAGFYQAGAHPLAGCT